MFKIGINDFEVYCEKLNKILDQVDDFCASIDSENNSNFKTDEQNTEILEIVEKIRKINTGATYEGVATKEKTIAFLYKHSIKFLPTDKVKGDFPISAKFLQNMIFIHKNQIIVHHSHVTGEIIGYAHEYCNLQTRENYYTIRTQSI